MKSQKAYHRRYRIEHRSELREKYKIWNAQRRMKAKTPGFAFNRYKYSARERGLSFTITMDQFMSFWNKPCFYCGLVVDPVGLDRVDNSKGYVYKNLVSCHYRCNIAKASMTRDEFIELCRNVVKTHGRMRKVRKEGTAR